MAINHYTPAQAAAITGLPLAAVHKAIDTRIIKPRTTREARTVRRLLSKEQIVYLQLEAEGLRLLPLKARHEVADRVQTSAAIDMIHLGGKGVVLVEVKSARRKVEKGLSRLARVEKMVVSNPEILSGTPVYRGTRIPVQLVADMLKQGAGIEEILEGYPSLNKANVELASIYVRAFPRRGRPARRPWAKAGSRNRAGHRLTTPSRKVT
jgi:uncharacterized protein (DUF433 family)